MPRAPQWRRPSRRCATPSTPPDAPARPHERNLPMRHPHALRRGHAIALLAAVLCAVCLNLVMRSGDALARTNGKPTIVLVHGAFADASGFGAVTDRLQRRGYTVI